MIELEFKKEELPLVKKAICNSIRERIEKFNFNGAVINLSGGVDSSLVTKLTAVAIGNERTYALILPEEGITPKEDVEDAIKLCKELNISYEVISINDPLKAFESSLRNLKGDIEWGITNLKPRVRMIYAYFYANAKKLLVVGTSNKTELLLGYGTKYGDLAADIYPIGDLYKTQVWQLAEYVSIPTDIVKKKPSAGLWKGQTDEEEIGYTYYQIDRVLFCLVELELSVRETSDFLNISEYAVNDLYERIVKNEHKRRTPTITKISRMCLDKDWKYPVERF
ncbi:MAG: NAD+ synthase [Candidatus Hydrothermales bacterium]